MEDRTFELIEKLYNRMEEGFNGIRSEMATKDDLSSMKSELKQDMTRMEQKFDDKISALFDGLTVNTEAVERLEVKVQGNTEAINSLRAEM